MIEIKVLEGSPVMQKGANQVCLLKSKTIRLAAESQ